MTTKRKRKMPGLIKLSGLEVYNNPIFDKLKDDSLRIASAVLASLAVTKHKDDLPLIMAGVHHDINAMLNDYT